MVAHKSLAAIGSGPWGEGRWAGARRAVFAGELVVRMARGSAKVCDLRQSHRRLTTVFVAHQVSFRRVAVHS
jgi:hypothetical protein